jgi:hypothetical protein
MNRNLKAALVAATLAVAAPAPAVAADFSLSLSAPHGSTVGRTTLMQVTGTIPPTHISYGYYFSAFVIPTSILPQCPGDHYSAHQVALNTGAVLTFAFREQPDMAGNFAFPMAFNPWAPGDHLVCAYTDDGATHTITSTSLLLNVQPAGASPPAPPPVNTAKPTLKRSGRKLVCGMGTWSNAPSSYAYRWTVNGKARAGGRTLAVTRRLRRARCSVTATNGAGSATAVSRTVRVS